MSGEPKLRAIVSIAQLVLGILLFISGLVLYFTPSGRAHEFIIFMSRGSWRYWYDIFAFALSGSSLIHIYFNFRSLKVLARGCSHEEANPSDLNSYDLSRHPLIYRPEESGYVVRGKLKDVGSRIIVVETEGGDEAFELRGIIKVDISGIKYWRSSGG